jgi:hypothetical protein
MSLGLESGDQHWGRVNKEILVTVGGVGRSGAESLQCQLRNLNLLKASNIRLFLEAEYYDYKFPKTYLAVN